MIETMTNENLYLNLNWRERILVLMQRSDTTSAITKKIRNKILRPFLNTNIERKLTRNFLLPTDSLLRKKQIEQKLIDSAIRDFKSIEKVLPKKPERILDIGSGMAVINLFVYEKSMSEPEIWLLDKEGESNIWIAGYQSSSEEFSHYNSFGAAIKALCMNGVKTNKIKTVNVSTDNFPDEVDFDVIYSFLSWGFHFSVEEYLDQSYKALKVGGVLILDARKGTNAKEILTEKFGKQPEVCLESKKYERLSISK